MYLEFEQLTNPEFLTEPPITLKVKPHQILKDTNIEETLEKIYNALLTLIDNFEGGGSGWILHRLLKLDLNSHTYDPIHIGTYIELDDEILRKKAVVNIKNQVCATCMFKLQIY